MTIQEMQEEIRTLKSKNDICILAHAYQRHEIIEIADYVGDSYALAKLAMTVPHKTVLMCGVRFMAETVKILAPDKRVLLSNSKAGCPMAEQISPEALSKLKDSHPGYSVVAYINTTAELKTLCDICVTSASAVKIISKMPEKDIIFIPDINLGAYVKNNFPDKNILLVSGGCPAHSSVTFEEMEKTKAAHPDALLLVHPECIPEVAVQADYIGSTTGIMSYAKESSHKEFIIGTENSIVEHLQYECPDKRFYPLSKSLICSDMQLTTLSDVFNCVKTGGGEEINMNEEIRLKAKKCIDKMISYGG